MHSNHLILSLI